MIARLILNWNGKMAAIAGGILVLIIALFVWAKMSEPSAGPALSNETAQDARARIRQEAKSMPAGTKSINK